MIRKGPKVPSVRLDARARYAILKNQKLKKPPRERGGKIFAEDDHSQT